MPTSHNLTGLLKFLDRPEWSACFELVLDHHFGEILGPADMDFDDLRDVLGDSLAMNLWGCAFEDFVTQDFDVAGVNIVDEYLKRRGWKEGAQTKAYLKALRMSVMSLYEVSDITPGVSLMARDVTRGGEPILVYEATATQSLKQWDKIAARVISVMDKRVFTGGVLSYADSAAELLFDAIRKVCGKGRSKKLPPVTDEDLRAMAGLFTMVWIGDYFEQALNAEAPHISNTDGDELMFHTARFPIAKGIRQKDIAERLNLVDTLSPFDSRFWNWLETPANEQSADQDDGLTLDSATDSGIRVLGDVKLVGRALLLSTNSAARAEKGMALIKDTLGDLVGVPLTEIQTLNQMTAGRLSEPTDSGEPDLPPELMTKIIHDTLDRSYRQALDEPIGPLGNVTPRQAVKTAAGRRKTAEWLKYLENQTAQDSRPGEPMATYSFLWMWKELGIADLRQ